MQMGLTRTFRGLRTGDPQLILMGAAFLAFAWLRSQRPSRQLLYRQKLKSGEGVTIRFEPPGS
jgi:hypothetical protein